MNHAKPESEHAVWQKIGLAEYNPKTTIRNADMDTSKNGNGRTISIHVQRGR